MRKNGKKALSLLLVLVMVLGMLPAAALAAEPTSGKCGDNLTWSLQNGMLTISGTGKMDGITRSYVQYGSGRGEWFFAGKIDWHDFKEKITTVRIEQGVTSIGSRAFYQCGNLTSVTIPDSVTDIGMDAFNGCTGLTSVNISNSVTSIGSRAFYGCTSLTSVNIPSGVATIEEYLFSNCTSLTSVSIPGGVVKISQGSFYGCTSLTSVDIRSHVKQFGQDAFKGCTSLENIRFAGTESQWNAIQGHDRIPSNVTIHYNSDIPDGGSDDADKDEEENKEKVAISLFTDSTTCYVGDKNRNVQTVTVKCEDKDASGTATWTSSNPSVFKLTGSTSQYYSGTSTTFSGLRGDALSKGTSTITVSAGGATASFDVHVEYVPTKISLACSHAMAMGKTSQLSTTITFGTSVNVDDTIAWSSSNSEVVAFSKNGQASYQGSIVGKSLTKPSVQDLTLYGLSEGYSTITCKLASGPSASFTVAVYDEEYLKLQSLALDWQTAFQSYSDAIASEVQKVSTVSENTIQEQALALQRTDDASNNKLVTFRMDMNCIVAEDESMIPNVYQAVAEFLAEQACGKLDMTSIDVSGADKDEYAGRLSLDIVQKIFASFDNKSYTYHINGATITIDGLTASGAFQRSISYKPDGSRANVIADMTSTQSQVSSVLEKYVNELVLMDTALVREAYSQMLKAGLGSSVNDLVKGKITDLTANSKWMASLKKYGLDQAITKLGNCIDYYYYVKKILSLSQGSVEDLCAYMSSMKEFSFDSKWLENKVVKTAMKGVNSAEKKLIRAMEQYIAGEKITTFKEPSDDLFDKIFAAIFHCPVSITVYDSDGKQVGYVGGDRLDYDESVLYIERYGDEKAIYSGSDALKFKVEGTDSGILDCTFETYTGQAPEGRINYYGIDLNAGKQISIAVSGEDRTAPAVTLSENGVQRSADEYIVASDYENKEISVLCSLDTAAGGNVYGTGSYVPGDGVTLHAVPEEGYVFLGWQNSDGALESGSAVYEFTAREDVVLTALFSKQNLFADVPRSEWYYDAVYWAVEQEITNGTSDTTFTPGRTCTETEILTFLWRAAGKPASAAQLPFTVNTGLEYAEGALRWAYEKGMIGAGYGQAAPCTRAAAVKFIWQAAGSPSASGTGFTDVPSGADYAQAVAWAVENGITNGTGTNPPTFSPSETCTRAQIVTFLYRDRVEA